MKTAKPIYSLHQQKDGHYAHAIITVMVQPAYSERHEELLNFRWQTDRDSTSADVWYGTRVNVEASQYSGDAPTQIARAAALVKKLWSIIGDDHSPIKVLAALESIGITRHVYDARISANVAIDKVQPADFNKWVDVSENSYATHNCMARNEDEARRLIMVEFGKQITDGRDEQRFSEWVLAGKPVKQARYADAPTIVSTTELLSSPFRVLEAVAA